MDFHLLGSLAHSHSHRTVSRTDPTAGVFQLRELAVFIPKTYFFLNTSKIYFVILAG